MVIRGDAEKDQAGEYVGGEGVWEGLRSSNKSAPFHPPLESPGSLLHVPCVGLAEGCVLGLCCVGGGQEALEPFRFSPLLGIMP